MVYATGKATRWSCGELADYWVTDYDWGKCEVKLDGLPNFVTEIDGLNRSSIHSPI